MRVGIVGFGAMGSAMAGHIVTKGDHEVIAFDVDPARLAAASKLGVKRADSIAELARGADMVLIMVATDDQALSVAEDLVSTGHKGALLVVASTLHPDTMKTIEDRARQAGLAAIDAPVVFGLYGAKEGVLVSLCGGAPEDIETARPVMMCYSRAVHHMGPIGTGMLAKTVNNMLHWSACVANFEALLLAKRYGLDAQRMREVLLDCPADSGTLRRWDSTRFTWPEKDMDTALDLAQAGGLTLPLFGQVDQLVKLLGADQVRALLHERETTYLGQTVGAANPPESGGQDG